MKCPVVNLRGLSMGLVWLWFMSFNVHVCVPVYLENYCGVSCIGTCWLLGGAWFQCRCGGFWMSSCRLMFPGVRSFVVFSSLGFKPSTSGFQSYSYSSLKTLHPYSTDDKTSRLMVKRFSTVRDTQRGSEFHGEEKTEEGDRGD